MTSNAGAWLQRFQPAVESDVRLVCFPYAGGSAGYYLPMARALAPEIEVQAVQYPGRLDRYREPCIGDLGELADAVFPAISGLTDRRLALFGHSMGAVLAFEVALRLEDRLGVKPEVIFASGRRAPSRYRDDEDVHLRDDAGVVEELKSLGGTNAAVLKNPELLEMALPPLRADYRAIETYRCAPGAAVSCPVVTVTGAEDPKVTADEARDWEKHTTGEFELVTLEGGHFFLTEQVPAVTELVAARLRQR